MPAYEGTSVSVDASKSAIDRLLQDRNVTDLRMTQTARLFSLEFNWPLREKSGECPGGRYNTCRATGRYHRRGQGKHNLYEVKGVLGVKMVAPYDGDDAHKRRMLRVLYWSLKTKLETVESGVLTFAEEFLPHLTLGGGHRVWDQFAPRLDAAIAAGKDLSTDMSATVRDATNAATAALPPGPAVTEEDAVLDGETRPAHHLRCGVDSPTRQGCLDGSKCRCWCHQ